MTAFAAIVAWDGSSPIASGGATELLTPLAFRSFDSRATSSVVGADVAVAVRAVQATDVARDSIYKDSERRWLAVGDVRLYDATAMRAELGASAECSDLELIVRMYARFGDSGLSHVAGDFSFVLWNWADRTVHAIRDHFGLRPLYYRTLPDGLALASDIRQLLVMGREANEDLDPNMVLDFLLGDVAHHGLSFYQSIRQVWPGHHLVGRRLGASQSRYWRPATQTFSHLTYPDMIDEWRRLFEQAVTSRLNSRYPIASYLSGGLDSGSIVGVAHREYARGSTARPPMLTLSALCPGLACDETDLILDASKASPLFRSLTWNASELNHADFTSPHPIMPGLRHGMAYGPRHELERIASAGIRVVFSGLGGDELGWSHGYFRDLVNHGEIAHLVRELAQMNSWQTAIHHLRLGMRGIGAFDFDGSAPGWAGLTLRDAFESRTADRKPFALEFESFSQQETWCLATSPAPPFATDASRILLNDSGAELRLPYWDLRLVEFVLRVPWRLRAPHGDLRRVQRDAVQRFLSSSVRESKIKVLAGSAVSHQVRGCFEILRGLIDGSVWTLSQLVDQAGARRALRHMEKADPAVRNHRAWIPLWRIALLEAWNRARMNYHVPGRIMMHDANDLLTQEPVTLGAGDQKKSAYEAPTMILVGNARELLAANFGPSLDTTPFSNGQAAGTGP